MRKVMATGVFDILHGGHIHYLEKAKELGDELIVVVASDNTAIKKEGKPIFKQEQRVEIVSCLKAVDKAIIGYEDDKFKSVEDINPDVIVLGYDQEHREEDLREELRKRGLKAEVVRLDAHNSSVDVARRLLRLRKQHRGTVEEDL